MTVSNLSTVSVLGYQLTAHKKRAMLHTATPNRFRSLALAAVLSVSAIAINAADLYVAPNGQSSGNGSISSPWDLATALAGAGGQIRPGDTVWLLAGTYRAPNSGGFNSTVTGTVAAPIVFRNYQGQHVTLDGYGTQNTIAVSGGYVWFWGLEITDSTFLRSTSSADSVPNALGVGVYAPGVRFINNVVHDTSQGFSAYAPSNDSVFYGNLSYYNGFEAADRNHGHGFYLQNITGTKFVIDNVASDNADEGFQLYGSGNASLVGFRLFGNVAFNNSSWPYENYQYNYIIAGGSPRRDIQVDQNHSFFTPSANYGFNSFGQYTNGDDMSITNNVFVGGFGGPEVQCQGGPIVFTGNKSYVQPGGLDQMRLELCPGQNILGWTWDNNQYYGKTNFYNGAMLDFASWSNSTGFDKHSTIDPNPPTGKWIYIRANQYESKRANIIIYNWDLSSSVSVDLSGILTAGDPYVIQDTQNFFGSSVASGTYGGTPISIPMTGLQKASPHGFATPPHTAPLFGAFVVMSSNSDPYLAPTVPSGTPGTAQFVKVDSTTKGNWKGSYGAEGYNVIGDSAQYPSYVSVTPSGNSFWAWATSTTDTRGLTKPSSTDRIEATWYSGTSFTVDLNFTDTAQHQVAFYSLDWENAGRSQTVDIIDGRSGALLNSQTLSAFSGGSYLVWNLSGYVKVRFTRTGNKNSVMGGIFFGAAPATATPSPSAANSAQFIKTDSTTQGSWKGVYGVDGYNVIGDLAQSPTYGTVTPHSQLFWAWASSTSDIRGLQKLSASDRIEDTWYSGTNFTLDLNLTDTLPHQVAFYSLDFENAGRSQTVDILDAVTGALLDSQSLSAFSGGKYLVWNITGHVTVRFTSTGAKNAVLSGVFFK